MDEDGGWRLGDADALMQHQGTQDAPRCMTRCESRPLSAPSQEQRAAHPHPRCTGRRGGSRPCAPGRLAARCALLAQQARLQHRAKGGGRLGVTVGVDEQSSRRGPPASIPSALSSIRLPPSHPCFQANRRVVGTWLRQVAAKLVSLQMPHTAARAAAGVPQRPVVPRRHLPRRGRRRQRCHIGMRSSHTPHAALASRRQS